jgi:hypothetical protein
VPAAGPSYEHGDKLLPINDPRKLGHLNQSRQPLELGHL